MAREKGISAGEVEAGYQRATRKPVSYNVGRGADVQRARKQAQKAVTEIRPDVFKIKTDSGVRVVQGKENLQDVRIDPGAGGNVGVQKDLRSGKIQVIPEQQANKTRANQIRRPYRRVTELITDNPSNLKELGKPRRTPDIVTPPFKTVEKPNKNKKGSTKQKKILQYKQYTPSGTAILFNIRGRKTKLGSTTGLGLRPITKVRH